MNNRIKVLTIICSIISLTICAVLFLEIKKLMPSGNTFAVPNKPVQNTEVKVDKQPIHVEDTVEKEKEEKIKEDNASHHLDKPKEKVDLNKKVVYLTFDDGPSHNTERILDTLKEFNVKATFFVIGNDTEYGKSLYRRIVDEGHAIGNHSYSHRYSKIYKSIDAYKEDTERLGKLLNSVIGFEPRIMRFPGGSNNLVSRRYSNKKTYMKELCDEMINDGYEYYDWNVSAGDCVSGVKPAAAIVRDVVQGVKNKKRAVILFHDSEVRTTTAEAVPEIIKQLKAMGYEFRVLTETSPALKFKN
ncbi:polysaccharide deacetylase [Fervidicella metallireducens AeB]|uniref:Polysaccharide deacetylase n=1 Tax=Fervidicella metallireducens AeB TaxID=1403537 RepID=A0A017RYQ1_9CLOT|nr:polysaccharide deacetylase family protein [Fervidicella metallireducens]EYE89524.1 polysaccharide deacetylase [Fervidicella metallireducens AeB]